MESIKLTMKRIIFSTLRTMLAKENRTPEYMGRTFAVGFCAAIFIFYGQSLLCLAVWLVMDRWLKLRFSVLLAGLLTFLSNPLTTPFIFYVFYVTGQFMLGASVMHFSSFVDKFKVILTDFDIDSLWQAVKLVTLGIGKPVILGSLPWHIIMIFVGYWTGVRVYWNFHNVAEARRRKKHLKRRSRLSAKANVD